MQYIEVINLQLSTTEDNVRYTNSPVKSSNHLLYNEMEITHRTDKSLLTTLLHTLIRPFAPLLTNPGKPLPAGSPQLHPPSSFRKRCHIAERKVDDVYIYDITPKTPHPDLTKSSNSTKTKSTKKLHRIYYIAGGSFCQPPSSSHWSFLAELIHKIPNAVITLLSPPLAPSCPAPTTYPHLLTLYNSLLGTPTPGADASPSSNDATDETITIAGDSSGASLALSLTLTALSKNPTTRAPNNLLLISPVLDLTFSNPSLPSLEKRDPVLRLRIERQTAISWAGDWALDDPRLSPIYHADDDGVRVLRDKGVKVWGVTGGWDILTPDAVGWRERCRGEGVEGGWLEWEGQMHCFPVACGFGLRESGEGVGWIGRRLGGEE
ncbi:hypothetical protein ACLMJK_002805 [Lecanora helva]